MYLLEKRGKVPGSDDTREKGFGLGVGKRKASLPGQPQGRRAGSEAGPTFVRSQWNAQARRAQTVWKGRPLRRQIPLPAKASGSSPAEEREHHPALLRRRMKTKIANRT